MNLKSVLKVNRSVFFVASLFGIMFISSCSTDDDTNGTDDDPILQTDPPIVIGCHYFSDNPNAVLEDNPNAAIDYIVTCNSTNIPDDVIIMPGVTIAFETNTGLWIRGGGSLKAVGTSDKKITFTGVDKARGAWAGIHFDSNDSKNELSYTIVEYSGGGESSWATSEKGGIVIGAGSSLKLTNSLIQHCKGWGVSLYYTANETHTTIENNIFKENEIPLQISSARIDIVKSSNQFIDNIINKVEVKNTFSITEGNKTMHKLPVPYSIINGNGVFGVGNGGHLVIQPGTVIEMGTGKNIEVADGASLKVVGTSSEEIIIRGAVEAPGAWGNIRFHSTTSPNNQFKHVVIKHAGGGANADSYIGARGAIYIGYQAGLVMSDSHFEDIMSCVLFTDQHGIGNVQLGENITSTNTNTVGLEGCIL